MSRRKHKGFICLAFQIKPYPYVFLQTRKGLMAISLN